MNPAPTFRDPAGSLRLEGDTAIRSVNAASREVALAFVQSPLYERFVAAGDVVATVVEESPSGLRLMHPRIAVPTYPWEWTPSQWMSAALLTLRLCEEALREGWILKDATPLNILFVGTRPVLVDVLSFERYVPGTSIWLAYGQYVRTFLLPLIAQKLLHWPLELTLFRRDGYEPTELYESLGWAQRLSSTAFWPVTLPALLEKRKGDSPTAKPAAGKDPGLALHVLQKNIAGLRARTRKAVASGSTSEWASYDSTRSHYTLDQLKTKFAWVRKILTETQPGNVLDIGANTGEFSHLAASLGAQVIALERDAAAAESLYLKTAAPQNNGSTILTIHADLSRPTPAAGWDNSEQISLLPRLEQQSDMVLMLAVIHHLILMEQIPIPAILALAHRLTRHSLVVEWVPPSDPMYQSLMRGRAELYGALSESDLTAAAAPLFHMRERQSLENGRILFLFERLGCERPARERTSAHD